MKLIKAIIQKNKLDAVKEELSEKVEGMTITQVKGFGHQKGQTEMYRGHKYTVFRSKIMLDIALEDDLVDEVVKIICKTAQTGAIGDGKIFVIPLEQSIRIRTFDTRSKSEEG